uniref:Uncharacterized protein n=1 Tax=Tolypothrix bouteillei VB521301 TaxID=1479485 RepID=A0A0C1N3P6_9CYAN
MSLICIGFWYRNYQSLIRFQHIKTLEQIWELTEEQQMPASTHFEQIEALEEIWQLPAKRES